MVKYGSYRDTKFSIHVIYPTSYQKGLDSLFFGRRISFLDQFINYYPFLALLNCRFLVRKTNNQNHLSFTKVFHTYNFS